ncbi:DUF4402 domain-containing protein [Parerythrobacter lacustris]|uniref:DUF4402 domain-containing protein n=1 Tax=Parerythrobacter lacustris TaxID=2969984 RepID=A0ABT1XXK0_9SPHN|nr:DUF4402 domain-containing protein [Parerythrobacter lacustris]MCR2835187.1 DUF4402 domain-containing protein [Parerythrobacter lacustris]
MTLRTVFGPAWRMAAGALALATGGQAMAGPGDEFTTTGAAQVTVVEPIGVQRVADLRFGRIMQPTTNGTMTLAYTGAISETGGVVGQTSTPQAFNGRGPGAFAVFGDANRRFILFMPNFINISNGTSTMRVDQFQVNPALLGLRRFDANGYAPLLVGARLRVNANQQVGTYTGTYTVSVLYL